MITPVMRSALCDWEEGTIFLAKCVEAEELGLNYAGLALEAALLACLGVDIIITGVAVAYAWRHCRVGRGEAGTRRRRVLVGKARLDGGRAGSDIPSAAAQSAATARSTVQAASCTSTQTDLSIAPDQLIRWLSPATTFSPHSSGSRSARTHSDPSIALAKATSDRALSKSDSWMDHGTPACTGQMPSVTPPPHARRVSQRPAAEKTSAKPGDDQRSFTQLAVSFAPELTSSCTTQEPRPRRSQRRSPPGPDQPRPQPPPRHPTRRPTSS